MEDAIWDGPLSVFSTIFKDDVSRNCGHSFAGRRRFSQFGSGFHQKAYPGQGTKIMQSLWGVGQMMLTKCLIVVEDDIDIHDLKQLTWYVSVM